MNNFNNTEELAFAEEKENLSRIEQKLAKLIDENGDRYNDYTKRVDEKEYYALEDKFMFMEMAEACKRRIQDYSSMQDCPYFARIDLRCEGSGPQRYYIGKHLLPPDGMPEIITWRSPIGMIFYQKSIRNFQIAQKHYQLLLRREIKIENSELQSVFTEYDINDSSFDGELMDPFLLSVLKDKRKSHVLTNIIRTIQENQSMIIMKPLESNFVVQGCAGSGKTMILLHRLSYLIYNYPRSNLSKWCIITPSKQFDAHIQTLSTSLGIDKIRRFTVEDYYGALWDYLVPPTEPLKTSFTTEVQSEKALGSELLKEIYSVDFRNRIKSEYEQIWRRAVTFIQSSRLRHIAEKVSLANAESNPKLPDYHVHNFSTYGIARTCLITLEGIITGGVAKYSNLQQRIQYLTEEIERIERESKSQHIEYPDARTEDKQQKNAKNKLHKLDAKKKEAVKEQERLQPLVDCQEYLPEISELKKALVEISYEKIHEALTEILKGLYQKRGIEYSKKANYRHLLYCNVLFASLYYSGTGALHDFVNIDEAQDLSLAEYQLLRNILGDKCVFNLYGDVNQLIYSYTGISNWNRLSTTVGSDICCLNENYRNTLQITEYCNQVFGTNVTAIGLEGSSVVEASLQEALTSILHIQGGNNELRCCIIHNGEHPLLENEIANLIPQDSFTWNGIEPGKISVLTVEMVKGLEFECVVTISEHMTKNEKYIAYTRALETLLIVEETHLTESITDTDNITSKDEIPVSIPHNEETCHDKSTETKSNGKTKKDVQEKDEHTQEDFAKIFGLHSPINLPAERLECALESGGGYVTRFFSGNLEFAIKFMKLGLRLRIEMPSLQLRICREYIGFINPGQYHTVAYVSKKSGKYYIKFDGKERVPFENSI